MASWLWTKEILLGKKKCSSFSNLGHNVHEKERPDKSEVTVRIPPSFPFCNLAWLCKPLRGFKSLPGGKPALKQGCTGRNPALPRAEATSSDGSRVKGTYTQLFSPIFLFLQWPYLPLFLKRKRKRKRKKKKKKRSCLGLSKFQEVAAVCRIWPKTQAWRRTPFLKAFQES